MHILMVASEVAPFSKEGGLADVLGALPPALASLGQEVTVISPLYRGVRQAARQEGLELERVEGGDFSVPIGDAEVAGAAWRSALPGSEAVCYFLQNDRYYDRDGYYTRPSDNADYQDNSERFVFLSRGAMEWCREIGLKPDIFHSHDWHTGLLPVYVEHLYRGDFPGSATVFTIHNLAYQGIFWHWDMNLAGLPWKLFNWRMLEYYGNLSFLKAGLVGADVLTTVSRTYADEIQTEEHGCGMEGVLRERSDDLYGIVNGVDVEAWNPADDEAIPCAYSTEDPSNKSCCKEALQTEFGVPKESEKPLVGMVCRLVDQKGLDLLREAIHDLLKMELQLVLLGTGDPGYEDFLLEVHERHPDRFGLKLEYNNELAHLVEAGADMFLMPSKFEPCGLNQLYSLRYGTVPIVRATGGLADTVTDYSPEGLEDGEATGLVFERYEPEALLEAVRRAVKLFEDDGAWRRLMLNGMRQDWSWKRSAREYIKVYEHAVDKVMSGADRS